MVESVITYQIQIEDVRLHTKKISWRNKPPFIFEPDFQGEPEVTVRLEFYNGGSMMCRKRIKVQAGEIITLPEFMELKEEDI